MKGTLNVRAREFMDLFLERFKRLARLTKP